MAVYDLKDLEERKARDLEAFYKARAALEIDEQLLRDAEFEGHQIEVSAGSSAHHVHEELTEAPKVEDPTNTPHRVKPGG